MTPCPACWGRAAVTGAAAHDVQTLGLPCRYTSWVDDPPGSCPDPVSTCVTKQGGRFCPLKQPPWSAYRWVGGTLRDREPQSMVVPLAPQAAALISPQRSSEVCRARCATSNPAGAAGAACSPCRAPDTWRQA